MTMSRLLIAGCLWAAACCPSARAQEMPEHVRKTLDRFVGKWEVELDAAGQKSTADFEVRWSDDKSTLAYTWKGPALLGEASVTANGTLGWDGAAQVVRERSFGSDGSTFEATHAIRPGADQWESPADGTALQDGVFVRFTTTRDLIWRGADDCVVENRARKVAGQTEPDSTSTFKRVKSDAARHLDFWKPMLGSWKSRSEVDGQTVEGTVRWDLSPAKTCLVSVGTGAGFPISQTLDGYDPLLRAWKVAGFNAAGDTWTLVVHTADMDKLKTLQAGAKGTYEIYRSLASGVTETETGHWSFPSWDEKQHVLKLTNVVKNGQPQPDVTIHYERQ